jgi:hypothetical protein
MGLISSAIFSGAASTFAFIAGSFSQAANAAPSRRTFGPKAHIHPKPRGRRSSGGIGTRSTGVPCWSAFREGMTGRSAASPASIRRISAERARSLADSQFFASPRCAGEIAAETETATSARTSGTRAAAGPATRRTTAFTR